jgi:hypothetical protein
LQGYSIEKRQTTKASAWKTGGVGDCMNFMMQIRRAVMFLEFTLEPDGGNAMFAKLLSSIGIFIYRSYGRMYRAFLLVRPTQESVVGGTETRGPLVVFLFFFFFFFQFFFLCGTHFTNPHPIDSSPI